MWFVFLIPTVSVLSDFTNPEIRFLQDYVSLRYPGRDFSQLIYVSVNRQMMYVIEHGEIIYEFQVSTARNGLGEEHGSEKTPRGLHRIALKCDGEAPLNGIIENNRYTGRTVQPVSYDGPVDYITTRCMRLEGLEAGINKGHGKDSYSRAIYIHGTHEEGLIGKPVSHGCIRMKNRDVITLHRWVKTGVYVLILSV